MGELLIIRRNEPILGIAIASYTGDFEKDPNTGHIRFLTNGTLVLKQDVIIDAFLVGGGGAGKYGGGGGGYTKTAHGLQLTAGQEYEIVIGEGAKAATTTATYAKEGGATSAFGITANGGGIAGQTTSTSSATRLTGGPGGSGGGGGSGTAPGDGGSNGASGESSPNKGTGGAGQGYTTRAFGEENGDLYAAGGGGCPGAQTGAVGIGGEPGAGDGIYETTSTVNVSAAPNTGSGGGGTYKSEGRVSNGGSGVVIIREAQAVDRQYLYSADDEHIGITNGWIGELKYSQSGSGATKRADIVRESGQIVLDNSGNYAGVIRTALGVDLTPYKTLVFEGEFTRGGSVPRNLIAAVWSKIGTYYATTNEMRVNFQMENAETINRIELDVSNLEGLGYPGIGVTSSSVKITACYLEPKEMV